MGNRAGFVVEFEVGFRIESLNPPLPMWNVNIGKATRQKIGWLIGLRINFRWGIGRVSLLSLR